MCIRAKLCYVIPLLVVSLIGIAFVTPSYGAAAGAEAGGAGSASQVTVSTNLSSYSQGDIIVVSGSVYPIEEGLPVTLRILDPDGNIMQIDSFLPNTDGTFAKSYTTGPLWELEGIYIVRINYGAQPAETTFEFAETITPTVSVSTDRSLYHLSDIITVSGLVRPVDHFSPITLRIIDPRGEDIQIDQFYPNSDRTFVKKYVTGLIWELEGSYIVSINYRGQIAETTFQFDLQIGDPPSTGILGDEHEHASILTRIFGDKFDYSSAAFQIKSSWIHFEEQDGNTIHRHATAVTLGYLFDTLGIKLTNDCFIFPDGREFCTNYNYSLKFYINHQRVIGIRDLIINGDRILISYGNETPSQIEKQLEELDSQLIIGSTVGAPLPIPSGVDVTIAAGSSVPGCEETNSCHSPPVIFVGLGETVTWYNSDTAAHMIASGSPTVGPDGVFDSGAILAGERFSHTFSTTGTHDYFCMVHPWATGTVVVQRSSIIDKVPPLILAPSDMTVEAADSSGARVEYSVKAIDDVEGVLRPVCSPPSGSFFPIGDNVVTCSASDSSGNSDRKSFTITVVAPDIIIPNWIKDVAGFWCNDEIDDASFLEAIQYLIDNEVITVLATESGAGGSQEIPSWIKNNACWWSQGLITNNDFASGLQYLIGQGIIRV